MSILPADEFFLAVLSFGVEEGCRSDLVVPELVDGFSCELD